MKILALDVSLTSTGYAFWDTREDEALSVGAIRTKSRGLPRYREILATVERIKRAFGAVDVVVFEGYPYFLFGFQKKGRNGGGKFYRSEHGQGPGNQIFGLAGITEMIKMKVHYQWNLPYASISPSSIKKYATGFGKAGKPQMIDALEYEHGITFKTDDEVDAWYIGQLARAVILFISEEEKPEAKHRLEAVKGVLEANNPEGTWNWLENEPFAQLWGRKKAFKKRKRHARGKRQRSGSDDLDVQREWYSSNASQRS